MLGGPLGGAAPVEEMILGRRSGFPPVPSLPVPAGTSPRPTLHGNQMARGLGDVVPYDTSQKGQGMQRMHLGAER